MNRGLLIRGPLTETSSMPVLSPERVTRSDTEKRRRVLVIDDNITQLDLYTLILEPQFRVLTATRGEDGYVVATTERLDAIVVDVILPDLDGLALCNRLLANATTASIPLIVLTGDDAAHARAKMMESQLQAILRKPCPADRLIAVLHFAVGSAIARHRTEN